MEKKALWLPLGLVAAVAVALIGLSAHGASVVAALEPVYGIALAFLLLHEAPEPRTLAGAVLIVAAAILASRRPNVRA